MFREKNGKLLFLREPVPLNIADNDTPVITVMARVGE
jgi:hypothetical protein